MKSTTYSVTGTHCHSCELLIENEVKKLPGVKDVSASSTEGTVKIDYQKSKPKLNILNKLFKDNGYSFSEINQNNLNRPALSREGSGVGLFPFIFVALLGLIYFFLLKSNLLPTFNVSASSFPPAFFIFGLLAGFSTCAALVGGLVLSLSQSWSKYKLVPVISFNLGRLIIFSLLGALLGYFGSFFRLSITVNIIITLAVSILMLVLGLQMLGVKAFQKFSLALPKSFTSKFSSADKFRGKYLPFILGGLTFFLPCGFTLTTQSLALASGKPLTGALIMAFFALGTFIPLFLIGLTGTKITGNKTVSQIAGLLLLIFALFNFKNQFNLISFTPNNNFQNDVATATNNEIIVLKMNASASGYTPSSFKVKAGQKVRWEITDTGTSGCTNGLIARSLFDGVINLVPGTTSVKEFTAPTTVGTYHFSCWMGMISGTIEVIN
ncbi:MAG: sulfite exporter TauE/SafE family protein [Candidatus Shapirobacteria bacterium]|jgi:sulfite exporter TauE/SafE/copper chaperone CopZ